MEQSLFIQFVNKYFSGIVRAVVAKLNDTKAPLVYYHKRFLKKNFSVDGKWESVSASNTMVMADVVAMDSSLPLKKRDTISKASGDIPKMGMELKLNEKQLTDLDTLALRPGTEPQLVAKLFADTPRVIGGINERNEAIFLEALSSGVCIVPDSENVGTGIRLDFGYLTANKFGTTTVIWSNTTALPLDDLGRMRDKATQDGNVITKFLMDRTAFNNMVKTTQVKEAYAFSVGFVGSNTQVPSLTQLNTFMQDRFGFVIEIIERSVRWEKNGVQTSQKPWTDGAVVGITTEALGDLVWATLAEVNHPVANVVYDTADDYILVSKYRTNRPSLGEWTSSQARVVPVLTNTDQIYLLDSKTVQA
ncbi:MAG: hypothetical protein EOP49_24725 [Sphingobacteriales bacterium]|nr:MAG: hypothetical protein EOP49_24725 [Sphingobacteriales bacterium]